MYLVVEHVLVIPQPRHHLPLWAAMVVSFSLSHLAQLLVKGFLLKLKLLGVAGLQPQLSLKRTHHPLLRLYFIHLQEKHKESQQGDGWWKEAARQKSIKSQLQRTLILLNMFTIKGPEDICEIKLQKIHQELL